MEAEGGWPALGEEVDTLAKLALNASNGHPLPAKVVLSWPPKDSSKVSELLIWESLENLLCSARIPRGFLNGVSLLSKGIQASFLYIAIITLVNLGITML